MQSFGLFLINVLADGYLDTEDLELIPEREDIQADSPPEDAVSFTLKRENSIRRSQRGNRSRFDHLACCISLYKLCHNISTDDIHWHTMFFLQFQIKKKQHSQTCRRCWWDKERSKADRERDYGNRKGNHLVLPLLTMKTIWKCGACFLSAFSPQHPGKVLSVPTVPASHGLGIYVLDLLNLLHPECCLYWSKLVAKWLDQWCSSLL